MTDSPLAALLRDLEQYAGWQGEARRTGGSVHIQWNDILEGVDRARAAILAKFATLEAERDEIRKIHHEEMDLHDEMEKRLHDKYEAQLAALRAEGEEDRIEEDTQVALAALDEWREAEDAEDAWLNERGPKVEIGIASAARQRVRELYEAVVREREAALTASNARFGAWKQAEAECVHLRSQLAALLAALTQGRERE